MILLIRQISIDGYQGIEFVLRPLKQLAILEPCPTGVRDRLYFMALDISREAPIDAFIEENLHLRSLCDDLFHGLVKERNHLLPSDGGEALEKVIDRLAPFEVIDERLHRNSSPGEHRSAT